MGCDKVNRGFMGLWVMGIRFLNRDDDIGFTVIASLIISHCHPLLRKGIEV